MDLALYSRVLWRFRFIVLTGVLVAILLATLAVAKISANGISYRKPVIWKSQTLMLLTQQGFPWGRAVVPAQPTNVTPTYADPSRFSSLTDLYSQFANSDQVTLIMRRDGAPKSWKISAAPLIPTDATSTLPVIALTGTAYSAGQAVEATTLGRKAFLQYVSSQQETANIPINQRIAIQVLQTSTLPTVAQGRKKTLPIIVVFAILSATFALAFILENVRPRSRVTATPPNSSIRGKAAGAPDAALT